MRSNVTAALCALGIGVSLFHARGADTAGQRRNHIAGRPLFYARGMDPGVPMPSVFDEAIQQIRNGRKISSETLQQCEQEGKKYFFTLYVENDVHEVWDMLESDRVNYFIMVLKWSIIAPEKYMDSFGEMYLMNCLQDAIKRRRLIDDDPFLTLSLIFPAVVQNDLDTAIAAYKELLEKDPFLARHAVKCHEVRSSVKNINERNAEFLALAKELPPPPKETKKP